MFNILNSSKAFSEVLFQLPAKNVPIAIKVCGVFPVESLAQSWRIIVQTILEKYSWHREFVNQKIDLYTIFFTC